MSPTTAFEARYPGRCGICDAGIEEGDLVAYDHDELCHHSCVEDEENA